MPPDAGYLYAIQAEGTPYVKIGSTTGAVETRLKVLQTGQPFPLRIVAVVPLDRPLRDIESEVHTLLGPYRQHGEWFALRMHADLLQQLVTLAAARLKHTRLTRRLLAYERRVQQRQRLAARAPTLKDSRSPMPRKRLTPVSPTAQHLADRVYVLRHTKRLTQRELAQAIGCSPATISGLESKKIGDITLEHLKALARVLGTTTDDLLGMDEEEADHAA